MADHDKFFSMYTLTPWDSLNNNQLAHVRLLSLKSIFKRYPVIEQEFFDDLISKISSNNHYSWAQTIRRIVGPNNEDYDISNWTFLWAMDSQRRIFQFLFQKVKKEEKSQGVMVALAPLELMKLFSKYEEKAVLNTLSLLNNPSKIKFLMALSPKGMSLAEEEQLIRFSKNYDQKAKFENMLKNAPNIQGLWFPSFKPKCPICNSSLTEIQDYRVGFGKLICLSCGYEKKK